MSEDDWWTPRSRTPAFVGRDATPVGRFGGRNFLSSEAREALEELVARVVDERLCASGADRREPELLTVVEAAERIRAKPQRIYDLLSDGRLSRHKDGSRVLASAGANSMPTSATVGRFES
jgi:excisionase family DNA binding protein